jgi:hypothetical protein
MANRLNGKFYTVQLGLHPFFFLEQTEKNKSNIDLEQLF